MQRSRLVFLVLGTALLVTPLAAQQSSDGSTDAAAFRQAQLDARALATAGDLDGAETLLAPLRRGRGGAARSHLYLGGELAAMANELAAGGQHQLTRPIVARALQHYARAVQLSNNSVVQAAAHSASGRLYERFVGDLQAAKASYRAAVQIEPRHRNAARKLERLEAAEKVAQHRNAWRK